MPCEGIWNTQKGLNEERLLSGLFTETRGRLRDPRNHGEVPRKKQQWETVGTLSLERVGGGNNDTRAWQGLEPWKGTAATARLTGRGAVVMG